MQPTGNFSRKPESSLKPPGFRVFGFVLALAIGLAGALLFNVLHLPLPWMLGPMMACTLASIARLPVRGPMIIRPPMTVVVGVLLGSAFSPAILSGAGDWIPTLIGMVLFVLAAGAACVVYFRRVGGFDLPTAYFAGMPGGLLEMVLAGERHQGDTRVIALIHSTRILLIVFSLPLAIFLLGEMPLPVTQGVSKSVLDVPVREILWLFGLGATGAVLGHVLRLPQPFLLGPMLASGAVHLAGITDFRPPYEIVSLAQLVLGVTLGCRFAGTPLRLIGRLLMLSLGSTLILVAIASVFAIALNEVTGLGMLPLLLAYSPGGLTETGLIALALQIDVAFVATHHIFRVLLVLTGAAPVFRLLRLRD